MDMESFPANTVLPDILQEYIVAHEFSFSQASQLIIIASAHQDGMDPNVTLGRLTSVMKAKVPKKAVRWFFKNM